MLTRDMEEAMRQIAREEIAADEMRKIENERDRREQIHPDSPSAVPGVRPEAPGTVFLADCAAMRAV